MPLWKITDKRPSEEKETKFKQENHSIELVLEEADISLIFHDALPEQKLDFMLAGPP
jgi:hypothetical protein